MILMLTSTMLVVSNTSPLSNLAIIGRLELVREQLGAVVIPPAVQAELSRNPELEARAALGTAMSEGWIRVMPLANPVPQHLLQALDLGEAEALSLAMQAKATLVLLDESVARSRAAQLGIRFTGALGILRWARQTGRILALKTDLQRLRKEARFFINPALEMALLISVGE
jgi:predicted nucleic acid-binding protein